MDATFNLSFFTTSINKIKVLLNYLSLLQTSHFTPPIRIYINEKKFEKWKKAKRKNQKQENPYNNRKLEKDKKYHKVRSSELYACLNKICVVSEILRSKNILEILTIKGHFYNQNILNLPLMINIFQTLKEVRIAEIY